MGRAKWRTEDDLAAVQYANELISGRLVMIDLYQLCVKSEYLFRIIRLVHTLLCESQETLGAFLVWNIEVLRLQPGEETYSLVQCSVFVKIITRDGPCRYEGDYVRGKGVVVDLVHNEFLHALHGVIKFQR
jgi:hypothetical protein